MGSGGTAGAVQSGVDVELVVGREEAGEESVFACSRTGKARSVSVLCHDLRISCDGLFDLGLS